MTWAVELRGVNWQSPARANPPCLFFFWDAAVFGEGTGGVWSLPEGSHSPPVAEASLIPGVQGKDEPGWLRGQGRAEGAELLPSQVRCCLTWDLSTEGKPLLLEVLICTNDFAFQSLSLPFSYQ